MIDRPESPDPIHRGSCLCGAVRFSVAGALPAGDACHCVQCRKSSGHFFASADVAADALTLLAEGDADGGLRWYQSSAKVRRGFCSACGSSLFWDASTLDTIAVALGAFDGPTGTHLHSHIFARQKGDYYEIETGVKVDQ